MHPWSWTEYTGPWAWGNSNSSFVRDTLCKVHSYKIKKEIMRVASMQDSILFNDVAGMFLPDLYILP